MATRIQKIRLSIFLIASFTVFLVFFAVLVGGRLFKRMDSYYIEYRNVSVTGLEAGAPVKYHGVNVGRVSSLYVKDPETVVVRIEVGKNTPMRTDTQATLTLIGITGLKFIELTGGSVDAPVVEPGGTIKAGMSFMETISGRAEVMVYQLENVLTNLSEMLSPATTKAVQAMLFAVSDLTVQLDTLLTDNRVNITSSMARLDTLLYNANSMTKKMDQTVAMTHDLIGSTELRTTLTNMNHITDNLKVQLDSLRLADSAGELHRLLQNANSMVLHYDLLIVRARDDFLRAMRNLEESLDNIRETTDIVRENPSVLIRGRSFAGERID